MRLYLDSADPKTWAELMPLGAFYGITTNPLLAHRAGWAYDDQDWSKLFATAAGLNVQELHIQLYGGAKNYVPFAEKIYTLGKAHGIDGVVKIPMVPQMLSVYPEIKSMGGKILLTACYHAKQAVLADALDADYLAPYVGRMADLGLDAMDQLAKMQRVFDYGSCRLITASLRSTDQIVETAGLGAFSATISATLAKELFHEDHSLWAVEEFEDVSYSKS